MYTEALEMFWTVCHCFRRDKFVHLLYGALYMLALCQKYLNKHCDYVFTGLFLLSNTQLEFRQAWAALIPPQPLQQDLIHTIHTHLRSRRVLREEDPVELTSPESLFKVKPNVRVKEREYVDHALDLNELIKVE